jgi:hypothetical protein
LVLDCVLGDGGFKWWCGGREGKRSR